MTRLAAHRFRAASVPVLTGFLAAGMTAGTRMPALGWPTWTKTGSMNVARIFHTATLLVNGQVLVAGGANSDSGYLASAELYDPSTGSWTLTGNMTTLRELHQAVLLPSGEVLVAGGENANGILSSAELYNPSTATWTATGSVKTARASFSLTVLQDGKVLAVQDTTGELYDPATGTSPQGHHDHARGEDKSGREGREFAEQREQQTDSERSPSSGQAHSGRFTPRIPT